jgi:hypothetical protein
MARLYLYLSLKNVLSAWFHRRPQTLRKSRTRDNCCPARILYKNGGPRREPETIVGKTHDDATLSSEVMPGKHLISFLWPIKRLPGRLTYPILPLCHLTL